MSAQPFVDYRAKILTVPHSQQAAIMGKSNLAMVESGLVEWSDVVTPSRIRSLREVVSRKRLTVDQMVGSGVTKGRAEEAWNAVHTATHTASEVRRAAQVKALLGKGYTRQQIVDSAGRSIGSRIGIIEGPSGPGLIPFTPKPTPRPIAPTVARVAALAVARTMTGEGGLAGELKFVRTEAQVARKDVLVLVDVARFDASLEADPGGFHVGPGGVGPSAIKGRYSEALHFLEKSAIEGTTVNAIEANVGKDGQAYIDDGRHRFAVIRDSGSTAVPVAVPKEQAGTFADLFGRPKNPEPAKLDEEGRVNLDRPATETFVRGLVRQLAERFGITYRGKS
jgi:hypothetical protein